MSAAGSDGDESGDSGDPSGPGTPDDPDRDPDAGISRSVRRQLRRLVGLSAFERLAISLAALALSILIGGVLVLAAGRMTTCTTAATTILGVGFCYDPVRVYSVLFNGALGNPLTPGWSVFNYGVALTLKETTLLVFTGLSVAVAFRAGLFNIGTQGQLVLGALATALGVGALVPHAPAGAVGTFFLVTAGLLFGAIAGGLYGVIPGALKAYADANEVITTIMLNFIATNVAFVLVTTSFADPNSQTVQTVPLPDAARLLPQLFPRGSGFALAALALGAAFIAGVYYLLERTSFGYDLRTSGLQPEAARYAGVDADRTTVKSFFLSGALGGIGGAVWVLMVNGKWIRAIPSLGFDGITVSILAGNNPLGVLPAAFLFGVLKSGAVAVQFNTEVPPQLIGVLRGLIILFVAMPEFFRAIGSVALPAEERPVAADGGRDRGGDGE